MTDSRRPLPIDALLRWAYREELPKEQAGGQGFLRPTGWAQPWGAITKTGVLGTEIQEPDIRNRYGLVPDFTAQARPHPDAITIWLAVDGLADMVVIIPEDWNPLSDMPDLGAEAEIAIAKGLEALCFPLGRRPEPVPVRDPNPRRRDRRWRMGPPGEGRALRRPITELVAHHAIQGTIPTWQAEPSIKKTVLNNGMPAWFRRDVIQTETGPVEVEIDGMDRKRRIPIGDAYQKHYYDPDPALAVEDRAEYEIWHAAVNAIGFELAGRLEAYLPLPSQARARPWECDERRPRVVADLRYHLSGAA